MKLHANVVRFAPDDGYIMDVEKEQKASEERYEFRFISPGYYLCTHGENVYCISQYMRKIGCACDDMTFNCKEKLVCKHLIQFMNLKDHPDKDISEEMAQLLKAAGWSGKVLTPPDSPENRRQKPKLPNIKDPARKPLPQAATRAEKMKKYASMTPEQIIAEMDGEELKRNARRGAPMAIAEMARRKTAEAVST